MVGKAESGEIALRLLETCSADVVTMDIRMGGMDGFETTRRIMESERPLPVVVISSCWDPMEVEKTFQAMEAGAVAILPKPTNLALDAEEYGKELLETVRAAASSKVGRLRRKSNVAPPSRRRGIGRKRDVKIVVIGASTGGPQALAGFLARLSPDFPCPFLVVQHMASGFIVGFAEWLDKTTPLSVKVARDGEDLSGGTVYLAPEGVHLAVCRGGTLHLSNDPPEHMVRPSASFLFRSAVSAYGENSAALLFSGMGTDGAAEMKILRNLGAATFVQDRETSVVWGMPGEAVRLDAAEYSGSPSALATLLMEIAGVAFFSTDSYPGKKEKK